jgi:hypothetical protein
MHLTGTNSGPVFFAAVSFLVLTSPVLTSLGLAADAATCRPYVREAVAKAQGVREFACGYDLKEPRWTIDRNGHAQWCKAAPKDAVAKETAQRRGEMKLCGECRAYARASAEFAAENRKLKCGLTGPRWSGDAAAHFGWCMALRESEGAAGAGIAVSYQSVAEKVEKSTHSETLDRIEQIATCKSRQSQPRHGPRKP